MIKVVKAIKGSFCQNCKNFIEIGEWKILALTCETHSESLCKGCAEQMYYETCWEDKERLANLSSQSLDMKGGVKMTSIQKFIKEHRKEIDEISQSPIHNDEERKLWILNHEGLYSWARSEGVLI